MMYTIDMEVKEMKNFTLKNCIKIAKAYTKAYAKNHVGRNTLEKECIKKGYLIKRLGEIYPDCIESEKNKLGLIALDFNSVHRKGEFIIIR